MKQKVAVRSVVYHKGKILLLRRHAGRPSISGKFELPGGKIFAGEQPRDALRRTLMVHAGLSPETIQLLDAVTYIDPDDRELQYVLILYAVGISDASKKVTMSDEYDRYVWNSLNKIQQNDVTNSTTILLDVARGSSQFGNEQKISSSIIDENTTKIAKTIIYSDGGSRGNPGPSACGYVIMDRYENVLYDGGEYIGEATSDVAECAGVRLALERAAELGNIRRIDFRIDSLLIVNQLNGIYKIRNPKLVPIYERISELLGKFDYVRFTHVPREYNRLADGVVNRVLDKELAKPVAKSEV